MSLKVISEKFHAPTPAKWRKVGFALLSVSSFISGCGVYSDVKWVAYTGLATGVLGTFLTNLTSEESK